MGPSTHKSSILLTKEKGSEGAGPRLRLTLIFSGLYNRRAAPPKSQQSRCVMRLSHYLRADLVVHGLQASNSAEALRIISDHLFETGCVPSAETAFQALMARERAHSTALGEGVAVPHAVIPALPDMLLLVATAKEPFQFGPPEVQEVDLLFTLLSPKGREAEHIKLLARICRLIHSGMCI